eukprot:c14440_g1_i1 orf=172-996(+)
MELTSLKSSFAVVDRPLSPAHFCCFLPSPTPVCFSRADPGFCATTSSSSLDWLRPPSHRLPWSHTGQRPWEGDFLADRLSHDSSKGGLLRFLRNALMENVIPPRQDFYTVGDFMTRQDQLFVVNPSTTVDEALEILVENRITGLPVVDDSGRLIGVVSDYDLLALDSISGKRPADTGLFPEAGSTWKAFREIQNLLSKTHGKVVAEVMTPSPLVVREMTNLEDAARLLLETKYRRLPVVDESGKLVGLLTRGNVVRAALQVKRAAERKDAENKV